MIGVFAALAQLQIAPDIVNGLFYALLAIVVGSAIVAIGGGGIAPMRQRLERWLDSAEENLSDARRRARQTSGEGRVTAEQTQAAPEHPVDRET